MTDKMTPEQRHHCMSRIRSKNTKPELLLNERFLAIHSPTPVSYNVNDEETSLPMAAE